MGPKSGADLRFPSSQPDTSRSHKTTDTRRVCIVWYARLLPGFYWYSLTDPRGYDTIRYDTIEEFNVTQKLSIQLNLAHVARKKYKKEATKTNKRRCPFNSVRVKAVR